jgi:anti-sigma B factor antagonist
MPLHPEPFSISVDDRDARAHVVVRGELDIATAPDLEAALLDCLDRCAHLVVDLRELGFIDSSGVRVLIAAHARAGRDAKRLSVVRPGAATEVDKVIDISGLDAEIEIVQDPGSLEG